MQRHPFPWRAQQRRRLPGCTGPLPPAPVTPGLRWWIRRRVWTSRDDLRTKSIEVRLAAATPAKATMTMTSRFASIADMEQVIAIGWEEGMVLAVEQIDAIIAAPAKP